jgi:tRNA(Ile)-lysidine synthase
MTEASLALDAAAFARLMARFEPFEPQPTLAAGASGGPDSLALALLAADWARARGGRLTALTVDHGLRPEAAAEARQVATWLAARGVAHEILSWAGRKPASGVQAAARAARHALLGGWCERHGVLHLLLAHHRGDQAETLALRREGGSGPDGLAAMAAETPTPWGRVLRPLLAMPKAALTAWLAARRQPWIEDPSNRERRYARVRLRAAIADAGSEAALAEEARGFGRARAAREAEVAAALARLVRLHQAGWGEIETGVGALPDGLAASVLARVIVAIGNQDYRPRGERLAGLLGALRQGKRGRTLGGCRIVLHRGAWVVARESASLPAPAAFAGTRAAWDRFVAILPPGLNPGGLTLGPVGAARPPCLEAVAAPARPALPALADLDGVAAIPHFGWVRPGADPRLRQVLVRIAPRQGLAPPEFAVA